MKSIVFSLTFSMLALSFNLHAQTWDELMKVVSTERAEDDYFGYTISLDGNRAAVSALDDEDLAGGATMLDAGSVYILEMQNGVWTETAKLVASDRAEEDRFGCRVSLDGDRLLIGAFLKDTDALGLDSLNEAGAAYIFDYDGTNWTETAILTASDRAMEDRFGFGISLQGDIAVIGSYLNDSDQAGGNLMGNAGAAYVFELNNGTWTETAKLVASDRINGDFFGYSVGISDGVIMAGAYNNNTDANGSNSMTQAGSAYVFEKVGGIWTQTSKLVASNREDGDRFGHNLAISGDKAVIGAYNRDHTGNPKTGIAYAFARIGGIWTETSVLVPSDLAGFDEFGVSVDIDGDRIVVGSRFDDQDASGANYLLDAGSAYVFELDGGVWVETQKIVASDRGADDRYGSSVAISGDLIFVGGYWDDEDESGMNTISNSGSVYVYYTCGEQPTANTTGNTLTANIVGASYQWLDCDNGYLPTPSGTNQSYTAVANGNYAVAVTIGNCVDTSACITIDNLGVETENLSTEMTVYPNPTTGQLTISNYSNTITNLSITDLSGKIVMSLKPTSKVIDLSGIENGLYLLKIEDGSHAFAQPIIKE
jgi:hypothetical protein